MFENMIGRKLTAIRLIDGETINFDFEGGPSVAFQTEADCCSETWFADIVNPDLVLGRVVDSCKEVNLPESLCDESRTRQESDRFYGFEIRTAGGVCIVAYRNSSNGYYGGDIRDCLPTTGGKLITEDYSA